MKYLRVLFLFAMALFCGSVASHAQGFNFHSTVLDPVPVCSEPNPAPPGGPNNDCLIKDLNPFNVVFSQDECTALNNPPGVNIPDGPNDGCFLGINDTGVLITTLSLILPDTTDLNSVSCDLAGDPPGPPGPIFNNPTCSETDGVFKLMFSGGDGIGIGAAFIIFESGAPPTDLGTGQGQLGAAPEPDSLLLLSTGVMMSGLYLAKRQRLFAFFKR